jgi:hypothetical protein
MPDEEFVTGMATAIRDFMSFHKASDLAIEKSQPEIFGVKLLKSI